MSNRQNNIHVTLTAAFDVLKNEDDRPRGVVRSMTWGNACQWVARFDLRPGFEFFHAVANVCDSVAFLDSLYLASDDEKYQRPILDGSSLDMCTLRFVPVRIVTEPGATRLVARGWTSGLVPRGMVPGCSQTISFTLTGRPVGGRSP